MNYYPGYEYHQGNLMIYTKDGGSNSRIYGLLDSISGFFRRDNDRIIPDECTDPADMLHCGVNFKGDVDINKKAQDLIGALQRFDIINENEANEARAALVVNDNPNSNLQTTQIKPLGVISSEISK